MGQVAIVTGLGDDKPYLRSVGGRLPVPLLGQPVERRSAPTAVLTLPTWVIGDHCGTIVEVPLKDGFLPERIRQVVTWQNRDPELPGQLGVRVRWYKLTFTADDTPPTAVYVPEQDWP